jgi:hypothetical protein
MCVLDSGYLKNELRVRDYSVFTSSLAPSAVQRGESDWFDSSLYFSGEGPG